MLAHLQANPCVDCGEADPVVLSFDHLDPQDKHSDIARLLGSGVSNAKLQNEIDKCEVVCCNCHARRTAKQQGWAKAGPQINNKDQ